VFTIIDKRHTYPEKVLHIKTVSVSVKSSGSHCICSVLSTIFWH